MTTEKYSIVTVAYSGDVGFMHLQARSMNRYVAHDLVAEIIVVENGDMPASWRASMLREYGALADLVKFVPSTTIATIPSAIAGWFSQQVLKLTVAKIVCSRFYLVLDAKNHFIFPFTRDHVESPGGKPKMFVHGYDKHPLKRYLEPILTHFRLSHEHVKRMLPTTPPFYINTELARDMMRVMSAKEQKPFEEVFFKSSIRFTEFFTIAAFILSIGRKFEDFYDLSGCGYSIIWVYDGGNDAAITREITSSEQKKAPIFSVHRGAMPLLTETSRKTLAAFWQRRGLFHDEASALRYLADPNTLG